MEIIDIETEIKMHGYDELTGIVAPKKEIIDFASFIEDLEIEKKSFYLDKSTKSEVINNTKAFFASKFKLNKVPYKGAIRSKLDKPILTYIPGQEIPLKLHNSFISYVSPFDLPLEFSSADMTECMVVENATFIRNDDFLKRMKITYRSIILPTQIHELTESSYVHEITHTQLAHLKGSIKNYFNREVLSIFLEMLNIYESKKSSTLLPLQDAIRLTELYQEIYMLEEQHRGIKKHNNEDLIHASVYSESIFKAYGLFTEYILGTTALKKYILNSIQNIFNGNLQLEELLDEFEITSSSVSQDERVKKVLSI